MQKLIIAGSLVALFFLTANSTFASPQCRGLECDDVQGRECQKGNHRGNPHCSPTVSPSPTGEPNGSPTASVSPTPTIACFSSSSPTSSPTPILHPEDGCNTARNSEPRVLGAILPATGDTSLQDKMFWAAVGLFLGLVIHISAMFLEGKDV
mgnify:CR=1 FL=1